MCKYCKNDDVQLNKDFIKANLDIAGITFMELQVNIFDDKLGLTCECDGSIEILEDLQIKYCPMCGRDLQEES